MHLLRREFGLLAASSLVLTALPITAYADPDDTVTPVDKDKKHHGVHTGGSKHHAGATTADHLSYDWKFGFHSKNIAQNDWKFEFPENGQASVLIDYKGNWQYSGSFPAQPSLVLPCRVTVGIGLKSSLGKILAVTKTIVGDLWKDVVKGHDWKWAAHTRQEVPQEPPPQDGHSSGGDSTFTDVADDLGKSLLGPIGFFL
jgi:hypothetical protein